jgi:hypothetical protein
MVWVGGGWGLFIQFVEAQTSLNLLDGFFWFLILKSFFRFGLNVDSFEF